MKINIPDLIDFNKVDILLEGFNKATGFVTAIVDLEGNVLSKSGWRQICTEFHRINPETSKNCTFSDTMLAGKMEEGEKYHFYKCLNGLIDVAVPLVINGEHIANLFSGQFFFEEPDRNFFMKQANQLGFKEEKYLEALEKVPVVSKEKVLDAMDFLLNMTQLISEMTFQKLEQIELNKNIRESENRFTKAFRSSPIAITITDQSSGKYIEVNESWCSIYGYTAEEAIGHTPMELGIVDIETRQQIIKELKTKGSLTNIEMLFRNKSGEHLTILFSSENIELEGETCIISTMIDVTDRSRAEERFKSVFESANVGKSITLLTGEINVNQKFCDMLGYPREELQNKKWQDITPEDEISYVQNKLEPLLKGEKDSARFEKRYICKNGTHIWADVNVSLHRGLRGEPLHFITTIIEITERKQAEEALRESQEQFRIAQDMSPDGFTILRPVRDAQERVVDFTWVYENAAVARLNGTNPEAVVGQRLLELFPGHRETPLLKAYQQVAESGETCILEADYSGESMPEPTSFRIVVVPMSGDIAILAQDITERKQAEEKQAKTYELLTNLARLVPGVIYQYRLYPDGSSAFPYSSPGMYSIYEVTPEQVREDATPVFGRLHPDDTDRVSNLIFESARTLEEFYCEFRVILPEQGLRWRWSQAHPERTEDGGTLWYGIISDISESKQAENALRESEERFRRAVISAPYPIMIHAENGQVITINTPWTQLTGYEHSDIPTIADWTRKAYGTQMYLVREEIDHLYPLDGPKEEGEYTITTSSGEQRIWDFSSAPIGQLPDGRRLVISMAMDVTERRNIETERKKFYLLAESSSEFIGMCDLDMNPLYVNPAGQRLVGLPDLAAACQIKVQDYFFPEDQRFIAEEFFPRVLREGHGDVEIRLRHFLSGEPIWMYYYLFSVRDAKGTVVGWATVSHDITERRLAAEEVHRLNVDLEKRVAERTAELRGLVNTMAGREVRMAELKDVIRQLRDQLEQSGLIPVADDPLAGL